MPCFPFWLGGLLPARQPDSFRQVLFFKLKPDGIVSGISHIGQSVSHSKRKENSGVCADRDAGVTFFNLT